MNRDSHNLIFWMALLVVPWAHADLTDGLRNYWDFDSNLTDQAHGVSGSASTEADDGSFVGGAGINYATGKFGSSIKLDGASGAANGHVDVGRSADTLYGSTDTLSISAWVRVPSFDITWQTLISHGEAEQYRIARYSNGTQLGSRVGEPDFVGGPSISDNQWHHIVAVCEDNVSSRLYVDGVQVAVSGSSPEISDTGFGTTNLLIGNNPETGNREWNGDIDDLGMWDRPLTQTEIDAIYNAGAGASIASFFNGISDIEFSPVHPPGSSGADGVLLSGIGMTAAGTLNAVDSEGAKLSNSTFTLAGGTGDASNSLYTIGGASGEGLLVNSNFSSEGGQTHSVRVRAQFETDVFEKVFTILIHEDIDADALSDIYENGATGGLGFLTGLLSGPGPGAGTGDFDGDGSSDLDESLAGTDPTDASEFPGPITPGLTSVGSLGMSMDGVLPARTPSVGGINWQTEDFFTGLGNFADLKGVVAEPNSDFIAVLERRGTVQRVNASDRATTSKQQVLDIRDRIVTGDNGGIRSFVFHPNFNQSGQVGEHHAYAFYSTDSDEIGFTVNDGTFFYRVSRFTRNPATGVFDTNSELVMIQQMSRDMGQHFGGGLTFSTDGFLYIAWGDMEFNSGRVGVPFYQDNQRIDRIFQAAMLRIDVDQQGGAISHAPNRTLQGNTGPNAMSGTTQACASVHNYYHPDNHSGVGYYIPSDNYWVQNPPPPGSAETSPAYPAHGAALQEHQAIGFRNPWRLASDPVTGDVAVFVAGSNSAPKSEEVEIVRPGGNFGWAYREGDHLKSPETGRTIPAGGNSYAPVYLGVETDPHAFWEGDSGNGNVSVGGVYYRGTQWPTLSGGKLIAADHGSGKIWALDYLGKGAASATNANTGGVQHPDNFTVTELIDTSLGIRQMAASPDGQDILIAANSNIWRLFDSTVTVPEPPVRLSQTGAFTDVTTLSTHSGLVPYQPLAPLWSDRAKKFRWVGVPNDDGTVGEFDLASEQIIWSENGEWDFPFGTTWVKHFSLPLDEGDPDNPTKRRPVETRFLIRGDDSAYFGFTYKWRADGSEADLIPMGDTAAYDEDITVTDEAGVSYVQTWEYPSRSQCMECHQQGAGHVLGMKTRQLNGKMLYHSTGITSHQLATMRSLGMFEEPSFEDADLPRFLSSTNVEDSTAPLEHRVRSYLDSNCSMCHRPESVSGLAGFDARLTTPLSLAGIIDEAPHAGDLGISGAKIVQPGDPLRSILYIRDSAMDANAMPPLARSLNHDQYIQSLSDWIEQLGMTHYNSWAKAQGIAQAPLGDDDGDDMMNIAEFVYGTNGVFANQAGEPTFVGGGATVTLAMPIEGDALMDGIGILIEGSTDMTSWYPLSNPLSGLRILSDTTSPGVDGVIEIGSLPGVDRVFVRPTFTLP